MRNSNRLRRNQNMPPLKKIQQLFLSNTQIHAFYLKKRYNILSKKVYYYNTKKYIL